MFFGCHTSKKSESDILLANKDVPIIDIRPDDVQGSDIFKPIVWEEDTGKWYQHNPESFYKLLGQIERKEIDSFDNSRYFREWRYKGAEIYTRLHKLPDLFWSIKKNGIREPIDVEVTGDVRFLAAEKMGRPF